MDILFALWFFFPAGIANSTPVFIAKIPFLQKFNQPIDLGKELGNNRIFGDHKTIRGFVFGILMAIITVYLQKYLYNNIEFIRNMSLINYNDLQAIFLGFCLGFGALFGDATKSFFKRRIGIKPGKAWIPFDQLDYIIGGIFMSLVVISLEFKIYLFILIFYFILHPASTIIGYLLGLKEDPI